jgi:[acyl-carrier-protein] S-malonyltransferase
MGRQLYDTLPQARRLFDEAASILGYNLIDICSNGPAEKLNSTVISQPAIFVCSLAALESLKATEPDLPQQCFATAGLSLGEYTALVFAGALSFADGLRVVQRRGEAMQAAADASSGTMVSIIGAEQAKVEEMVAAARGSGVLQLANLLCPGNTVVSGDTDACARLETKAQGTARTVRLAVAGAFHTSHMQPAVEPLSAALAAVKLQSPRIPVWSNVDAQPHTDPAEIRQLLVRQVVQSVLWEQSLRNLLNAGCESFVELGPGRVLAGLLKRINRKLECRNVPA